MNEAKPKTLAQHRAQHTRSVLIERRPQGSAAEPRREAIREKKQWNTYLADKGYELASLADYLFEAAFARGGQGEIDAIVARRTFGGA